MVRSAHGHQREGMLLEIVRRHPPGTLRARTPHNSTATTPGWLAAASAKERFG
jgi:hypothetical protein